MSLNPLERKVLQEQFRKLFENMESWEAMSVQIGVSVRTLMDWNSYMGLKRKRFKRPGGNYNANGTRRGCSWPSCKLDAYCRGYCKSHYNMARKDGRLSVVDRSGSVPTRSFYRIAGCNHKSPRCECINPGRDYRNLIKAPTSA